MANIMFFDPAISGHHSEYIRHIIKYIPGQKKDNKYYFIVNHDFNNSFPDIKNFADNDPEIRIIEIEPNEYDQVFSAGGMVKRSVNEFRVMNSYAAKFNIDHAVLLYANGFQFALGRYKTSYTISGILFGQYTWQVFPDNFKGWLYKKRKQAQTSWMLRNNKLTSVFLLNDTKSCGDLNKIHNTTVFKYLPDPVADLKPDPLFDLRDDYKIPSNHKAYLHIGSLELRKGVLDIIDSLKFLDENVRSNISVFIMGRASASTDQLIQQKIKEVEALFEVSIIYENAFIDNSRLKSMFEQTDFILMPYKNTEASSGILGHAIVNNKLVIGPKGGLLGHLIAEYKLGYLLSSVDSHSIAKAITVFFYSPFKVYNEKEIRDLYLKTHTGNSFAQVILNSTTV